MRFHFAAIEGIGAARIDKYGAAVLEVLRTEARVPAAPPAGCAVERSPGLRLSGSQGERP